MLMPVLGLTAALIGFFSIQAVSSARVQAEAAACQGNCVSLQQGRMTPDEIAVKEGSYVQFNTADDSKHNIALGDGADDSAHSHSGAHDHTAAYSSGDFGKGEAWRVQFKAKGTYKLHDHYNPSQRILVVVY